MLLSLAESYFLPQQVGKQETHVQDSSVMILPVKSNVIDIPQPDLLLRLKPQLSLSNMFVVIHPLSLNTRQAYKTVVYCLYSVHLL